MFVDVGAYGNPAYEGFNAVSACRDAEDFVREKKGYQVRPEHDMSDSNGTAVAWWVAVGPRRTDLSYHITSQSQSYR